MSSYSVTNDFISQIESYDSKQELFLLSILKK
ncbi:hypothetical protein CLLU_35460 [Clostridium luticellarii]|uniref:Uncharacterized protein n=1 Tax=Clostridium luticellarii TaxID=1691940 RepID=A0A2T0B5Q1_9CLOT|nr:hypothetical protein CLLU_35460 [Clostridium luticellarii]